MISDAERNEALPEPARTSLIVVMSFAAGVLITDIVREKEHAHEIEHRQTMTQLQEHVNDRE